MFVAEMVSGSHAARSQALQADALDFFGDAVTYGISLAVIGVVPEKCGRSAALVRKEVSLSR
jgi:Co/Zn/Cd efflux system component